MSSDRRMNDAHDFLPMNPRDYLVLFALVDGERHGYGIVKEVEDGSGGSVRMDPSNLYRCLKRLLRDGLVEEAGFGDAPHSEGRRRNYRITRFGRRVVTAEAERLAALTLAARARRVIAG